MEHPITLDTHVNHKKAFTEQWNSGITLDTHVNHKKLNLNHKKLNLNHKKAFSTDPDSLGGRLSDEKLLGGEWPTQSGWMQIYCIVLYIVGTCKYIIYIIYVLYIYI